MNESTRKQVKAWLTMHNGNVEQLAKWMRDSLRIGGIKACRALIAEALA